jgi:hypothetical protein
MSNFACRMLVALALVAASVWIAACPASAQQAARPASVEELRLRAYDELMKQVLPKMTFSSGTEKGQYYDYRARKTQKALAICVDWTRHAANHYSPVPAGGPASPSAAASSLRWSAETGQITAEQARTKAMANCKANARKLDCQCVVADENDRNVLVIPNDFADRALAKVPQSDAEVRQLAYARIMEVVLARKTTDGRGVGASYIGQPNDYQNKPDGKALAVCLKWQGRSVRDIRIGGSHSTFSHAAAPRMTSIREEALSGCAKYAKDGCRCQLVDENKKNVLEVPSDFARLVQGKTG